jgi:hypothetical protein
MKRAIVFLAVFLVLSAALLPSPASAHGGWWWPGALVGGLVVGAVALATAPIWILSAALVPPPPYAPAPYGAPPAYYAAPPSYYAAPPAYSEPAVYSAPSAGYQRAATYAPRSAPQVQREVIYPNGRYLLFGDGVNQPWQWAWEPASASPSASPPSR